MDFPILTTMMLVPLAGAIACLFAGSASRMIALGATLVTFALGVMLWAGYEIGGEQWQFTERADLVGQMLAMGLFLAASNSVPFTALMGSGRAREAGLITASQVIPALIALYFGVLWFGLLGAAAVQVMRLVLVSAALHGRAGLLREGFLPQLAALVIIFVTLSTQFLPGGYLDPVGLALRTVAIGAIALWALHQAPELLSLVPARIRFWQRFTRKGAQ